MTCEEILKIKKEIEEKINENKKLFIQALEKINNILKEILINDIEIYFYTDEFDYEYYIWKNNLDGEVYILKGYYDWEDQKTRIVDEVSLDEIITQLKRGSTPTYIDTIEKLVFDFEDILKKIKQEYRNLEMEIDKENEKLKKIVKS